MRNTWVLLVAILALLITVAIVISQNSKKHRKRSKKPNYQALANTKAVRDLPEYKSAKKKYRLLLLSVASLFLIIFSSTAVLVARPVSVSVATPEYDTRDIMLCLDVSGSMYRYIEDLSNTFIEMTNDFKGQRIGITIFDGVYMNLVPLSDDYDSVIATIESLRDDFSKYTTAIISVQSGVSEIGPGLVGCVNSFDKLGEENRMRAIILATDNYASSSQPINLLQAANYAKRYSIVTYGLSIADTRSQQEIDQANAGGEGYEYSVHKEFREAMLATGGSYYAIGGNALKWMQDGEYGTFKTDSTVVKKVVNSILDQAAAHFEGADTLIRADAPLIPAIILAVSLVLFFVIIWRLGI